MNTPEIPKTLMDNTPVEMETLVQEGLARLNLLREEIYLPPYLVQAIEDF